MTINTKGFAFIIPLTGLGLIGLGLAATHASAQTPPAMSASPSFNEPEGKSRGKGWDRPNMPNAPNVTTARHRHKFHRPIRPR
jgi:hypothetical protein